MRLLITRLAIGFRRQVVIKRRIANRHATRYMLHVNISIRLRRTMTRNLHSLLQHKTKATIRRRNRQLAKDSVRQIHKNERFTNLSHRHSHNLSFIRRFKTRFRRTQFMYTIRITRNRNNRMTSTLTRTRSLHSNSTLHKHKVRFIVSFNTIPIFFTTSHTSFSFRRNIHNLKFIRRFFYSIRIFARQRYKAIPRI